MSKPGQLSTVNQLRNYAVVMVKGSTSRGPSDATLADAADVFQLLATPGRLHLLWLLADGEFDVTTLASALGGTKAAISQHLAKLKLAGWVDSRREGRHVYYQASDPHIITLVHQAIEHVTELAQRAPRARAHSSRRRALI
jgi:DNA-binding transcriptional ArsR family regulator